jgi:para-aminobenzoate synthetase
MRTLLIDNHDSFTYNLYQYLAACNGQEPIVVRNDEMTWDEVEQIAFDNIVISPGPGRPQRPSDLGLSADALRHSKVPLLGVCLGHQAIAHHCGATVDLALRPMHGRVDRISHAQRDLFRGIPDRFEAVRYHSLGVTSLPAHLEPLAWAPDGTLMALRHLRRPWWGVQFHPESICTEFGARLLRNFRELSEEWATHKPLANTMGSFVPPLSSQGTPLTLHAQCLDVLPDAAALFGVAFAGASTAFWLDSSLADDGRARFSFMGDATGPRASTVSYRADTGELTVVRTDGTSVHKQSVFDYLQAQLADAAPSATTALPFEFAGGFVGYFGYELRQELGSPTTHRATTPDALWLMADRFVALDHERAQTWIVCLDEASLGYRNRAWMSDTAALLFDSPWEAEPIPQAPADASPGAAELDWRIPLSRYRDLILASQYEILQGETYELCLTNQLQGQGKLDALAAYRALRARNPAPYSAYLQHQDLNILCASPELFLHVGLDRQVDAKPIKGTAARGSDSAEDAAIARHLREDEKTRAENLMIVDLLRNDLNRVCEVGTVHVPALFEVETFATVHQLVSTIRGTVKAHLSAVDVVKAAFPGGSMTGAPKIRTMGIIERLEEAARGVYSGSIGYLSLNGAAQLNIVIRTIVAHGNQITIGSGGAIIALSNPDEEVREIGLKAHAQREVLQRFGFGPSDSARQPGTDQPSDDRPS